MEQLTQVPCIPPADTVHYKGCYLLTRLHNSHVSKQSDMHIMVLLQCRFVAVKRQCK